MTEREDGIDPSQPRSHKLAFGIEPSTRLFKLRLARYKGLAESVANAIREKGEGQVALLDIGVGSGRSMRYIEAEGVADQIDFYGIDLKQRRLSSVYSPQRWHLFQGDIEKGIPFKAGKFDIVLCEQVLEHLTNPPAAINEIARVLRPNGILVLGVPIFPWGLRYIRRVMVHVLFKWFGITRSHLQTFDSTSLKRLLCEHNRFTIIKSIGFKIFIRFGLSPLENFSWYYRLNRWVGRHFPNLCSDVQIVARKNPVTSQQQSPSPANRLIDKSDVSY
jgi:SAM-dependent methyltransferase